ncbi:hypothetical protein GCM10010287_19810 [Streptomyces variabilis]|uniref:Uncharacterized protein n=1 Tax=Streptomyces variabilis TaxID=67372 RepID=A0ABQ2TVP2_9ACTN|nr:hypothetical protein GCM10010265_33670 [Streptomyces griseoincarnatus]GGT46301.1 hypothetical protein GCM10010287_19810 [Streptomyces variabilis]
MGQQGCRAPHSLGREVDRQGSAYGRWSHVAFEPRRDAGCQVGGVVGREEQAGVVAAQVRQEVGGGLEDPGTGVRGTRHGGERLACRLLARCVRQVRCGRRALPARLLRLLPHCGRLVAGDRAGDDAAGGRADAFPPQTAVRLQLPQSGGDTGRSLGEARSEGLDVGRGALRQGLEVGAEADGEERQLRVLGQVVADHHEAGGVAGVVVLEPAGAVGPAGVRVACNPDVGARGRARVLRIHQEGPFFLGGQALALGLPSRRGPSHVCGRGGALCVALR